jgi:hypothetical protein
MYGFLGIANLFKIKLPVPFLTMSILKKGVGTNDGHHPV